MTTTTIISGADVFNDDDPDHAIASVRRVAGGTYEVQTPGFDRGAAVGSNADGRTTWENPYPSFDTYDKALKEAQKAPAAPTPGDIHAQNTIQSQKDQIAEMQRVFEAEKAELERRLDISDKARLKAEAAQTEIVNG